MIFRAALTFGMAWLLVPHHPDLGLGVRALQSGDSIRQVIFARLREVRSEIAAERAGIDNLVWGDRREVALQNAGHLPGGTASHTILGNFQRAIDGPRP